MLYPSLDCLKNFSLLWVSVDNWFNLLQPELQQNEEIIQGKENCLKFSEYNCLF